MGKSITRMTDGEVKAKLKKTGANVLMNGQTKSSKYIAEWNDYVDQISRCVGFEIALLDDNKKNEYTKELNSALAVIKKYIKIASTRI